MLKIGVAVIVVNNDNILLARRHSKHGFGEWAFPGGHLEDAEMPVQCAARELREETGLVLNEFHQAPWTYDYFDENRQYITLFFITNYNGNAPKSTEPHKSDDWQWFAWDNLPTPLFKPIENLRVQHFNPCEINCVINHDSKTAITVRSIPHGSAPKPPSLHNVSSKPKYFKSLRRLGNKTPSK